MSPRSTAAGGVRRLVLTALLGTLAAPARADDVVARSLLETGKDAFAKKNYDEAIRVLERARIEAPAIAESAYWIAASRERLSQTTAAVAAYRLFRAVASATPPTARGKVDADLLRKTQARLLVLAPGEAEDERLRSQFASEMMALSRASPSKDPAAAALGLAMLLRAEPERDDVRDLLDAATASLLDKGQTLLPTALRKIERWQDPIGAQTYGVLHNWKYEPPGLVADTHERQLTGAPDPIVVGTSFAIDMEMRIPVIYGPLWAVGFGLVHAKDRLLEVVLSEKRVRVVLGSAGGGGQVLSDLDTAKIDPAEWHRL